jgi:hypothetical protein
VHFLHIKSGRSRIKEKKGKKKGKSQIAEERRELLSNGLVKRKND